MKKDSCVNTGLPISSQIRNILQDTIKVQTNESGGSAQVWISEMSIADAVELIMDVINVKEN